MAGSRRARRRRGGGKARGGSAGRWTARVGVGLLVLGALGVLGGYFWFQNYLRSDRFRALVNERVSDRLEAEAEFSRFAWDGMEVHAPEFRARGEGMIRRIDLEGLETEIRFAPLLGKRLEAQEIRGRRLELEIDVTKEGPAWEERGRESFTFSGARIDELVGMVDFGTTALKWDGMKATLTPGSGAGSYDATLSRGRLLTPLALFPELVLQEASLRYGDGTLFLKRGDWKVFESGRLLTDGEVDFGRGKYFVNGQLTRVQCEEVLPDDWRKRLRGELSSNFSVRGDGKKTPVITGSLELVGGSLTALPVLDRIAAYTSTERFRRLSLRKASLDYRQEGERLELTKIEIASEGLLRMEGWLTIENGQLDGEIQLGLTPATLARIPGAAERVFVPGREGMNWSPVRISGTTLLPQEDLSERLIAAGFAWMYEVVGGELVLKESGRAAEAMAKGLWTAAGEAGKLGVGIVEGGSDLLKNSKLTNPAEVVRGGVGGILDGLFGTPSPTGTGAEEEEEDPDAPPEPEEQRSEEEEKKIPDPDGKTTPQPEGEAGEKAGKQSGPTREEEGRSINERFQRLLEDESEGR